PQSDRGSPAGQTASSESRPTAHRAPHQLAEQAQGSFYVRGPNLTAREASPPPCCFPFPLLRSGAACWGRGERTTRWLQFRPLRGEQVPPPPAAPPAARARPHAASSASSAARTLGKVRWLATSVPPSSRRYSAPGRSDSGSPRP